jgi:cyclic dehypoxanthinyl futalosine synthase
MTARRISIDDALKLWQEEDVVELGALAQARRMRMHPQPIVTYIVDRNINYTNICVSGCRFCAFYRPLGHPEGYVLSMDELARKVQETMDLGGRQVLLQGGMNPELGLDFYESMLRFLKKNFPQVAVHGFSPPEIFNLSERSGLPVRTVIARLITAGLDSIPGGGAEILVDRVRREISPSKCSSDTWLEVMTQAHNLGLKTTATMMFGHRENIRDRLEHLSRLRDVQDRTAGFTAFIPWTFQPKNTQLDVAEASSAEYLKFLALSRLFLDNIANIQASWVTQGPQIGQMALLWGANDFGSTMIEENVVAAAGVQFLLSEKDLCALVRAAGFEPRRRRMDYTFETAAGPRNESIIGSNR